MPESKISQKEIEDLFQVISTLQSSAECALLFEDLCTKKEIEQMAQRIQAARLLLAGQTYQQVMAQTDISSATLSRVSRCVHYGNGYKSFLK